MRSLHDRERCLAVVWELVSFNRPAHNIDHTSRSCLVESNSRVIVVALVIT